jgi:hypothetical protein
VSRHYIYTLWASLREDPGPWMVAAEDQHSWEGNPERCEAAFQAARDECDKNDWAYREIEILVDYEKIVACFESGVVEAEVATPDDGAALS